MQALRDRISSKLSDKSKKDKDGSSLKSSTSVDGKSSTMSEAHHHPSSSSSTSPQAAAAYAQSAERGICKFLSFIFRHQYKNSCVLRLDQACYFVYVFDIHISSISVFPPFLHRTQTHTLKWRKKKNFFDEKERLKIAINRKSS